MKTYSTPFKGLYDEGTPTVPGQGQDYFQPFHPEDYQTRYLTADEAGELLRMKREAVRPQMSSGQIRSAFIGRRWLTTRSAVDAYLEAKSKSGPANK